MVGSEPDLPNGQSPRNARLGSQPRGGHPMLKLSDIKSSEEELREYYGTTKTAARL